MHVHAISLLSIQHFGKEHGSETHGPKADNMEMGAILFTIKWRGKELAL